MDLFREVEKFHFTRNGYRVNLDRRPENQKFDKSGRQWLKVGPYSNTARGDHRIVQEVSKWGFPATVSVSTAEEPTARRLPCNRIEIRATREILPVAT